MFSEFHVHYIDNNTKEEFFVTLKKGACVIVRMGEFQRVNLRKEYELGIVELKEEKFLCYENFCNEMLKAFFLYEGLKNKFEDLWKGIGYTNSFSF